MDNSKINKKDFSYPNTFDKNLQSKLFKKREFYYHKIQPMPKMKTYEDIQNYRNSVCKQDYIPREQQAILTNMMNPNTPYKGLLVMHGTGTGKSCTAISIAEQFKDQIKKYNSKIYILTFGPNGRETIKKELLFCTGETYLKNKQLGIQLNKEELEYEERIALNAALQNYKILSYKTFYKKVLGEKIIEKRTDENSKHKYRRTEEGELEREIVIDKINNMDNSLLIVDEAHNLTGNEYGLALNKIIKNSKNLRLILLSATPMKNLADDIIDLLNFIRPQDDPILRDKIFTSDSNYNMKVKENGLDYLKEKARGYISYFRGNIPYTFAEKVDEGLISNGLLFTPVIKCFMEEFQCKYYLEANKIFDDKLAKASSSAANFIFPGLNEQKNDIIGYHSMQGVTTILSQIETDGPKLCSLINKKIFNGKLKKEVEDNFMYINDKKNLTGDILKKEYLKYFGVKFYSAIKNLDRLVDSDKGSGIVFIYSNLVNAGGIELFAEALIVNGYLEYLEDKNYDIKENTIHYKTGKPYSEYKKYNKVSEFKPATFILITGSTDDEEIPEIKQKIIRNVYNDVDNIDGKNIKLCLGSRVMNEGVTLENVKEIHILDVHYNLGKVDQIIGRGIRMCKHMKSINENNKFPKVNIFRYVVGINNSLTEFIEGNNKKYIKNEDLTKKDIDKSKLSTDEILYQKAELKYLVVKKVERALKEVAIDCPLLLNGNIFPDELEKYKDCHYPTLENVKAGKKICPALCDFKECTLKCEDPNLQTLRKKNEYEINKKDIDYNTFNDYLSKFEIVTIKNKIKDLYRFKYVFIYEEILENVKKDLNSHQLELFENYFLDQALEDLMPKNENDFNNFKDYIYDKYNRTGYIIQRDKYFIFQPFDENEDVSMFYRQHVTINETNMISIDNYIKQKFGEIKIKEVKEKKVNNVTYHFDKALEYYSDRPENFIVGIIDINLNRLASDENDLFKIREPRSKTLDLKRGTGIPTLKGSVCNIKSKEYLLKLLKKFPNIDNEIKTIEKMNRDNICQKIKDKLIELEKYSTTKDNNKMTYIIIPYDHPIYPFPLNLEDRVKDRINKLNNIVGEKVEVVVKKNKDPISYTLEFKKYTQFSDEIIKLGFTLENKIWSCVLS
jgi:hypothetical protein